MSIEYIHHITLHAPIVMTVALTALGVMTSKNETPELIAFLRWSGWITLALTSAAAITGILSAPGMLGGGGDEVLRDHRDLGVTAWCIVALAAFGYDQGVRDKDRDWRLFGISMWGVAAITTAAAAHWGGLGEHAEIVPF